MANSVDFRVKNGLLVASTATIQSTVNATSTITGALQVIGGAGIGGNLYVGGEIVAQRLTIELTTVTTSLVTTDDIIKTTNSTNATSTNTGALQVAGGTGIGRDLYVGGTIYGTVSGSITTATNIAGGTAGAIHYQVSSGVSSFIGTGTTGSLLQMGATTATFVSSSSVYVGFANQAANATTATSAAVAYSLANTSTTYVGFANQAVFANTATNVAGGTTGAIIYQNGTGTTTNLSIGTAGQILTVNAGATAPQWVSVGSLTAGLATTATNLAGGTAGAIHYQISPGISGFIGTGTIGSILQMGANTATFVTTGSIYVGFANQAANATTATSAAVAYSLASTSSLQVGYAAASAQINTLAQPASSTYYLTFVDSNNATTTAESVYTTGTFIINPATGQVGVNTSFLTTSSKLVVNGRIESITDPAGEGGQVVLRGRAYRWSIDNYFDAFRLIREDDVTESNGASILTVTSGTNNIVVIGGTSGYSGEKFAVNGGVYINGTLTATNIYGTFNGTIGSASVNTATNLAGGTAGAIVYQVSSGATSFIGTGAAGSILQMGATTATFVNTSSVLVGSANNIAGGALGQLHYQTAAGVTGFIGTGTSGSLLQMGANTATFVTTGSIYVYRATLADSATGSSGQVSTVAQTANGNYFLTFVDSNNATATAESVYTTNTVYVTPSTGQLVATSIITTQNGTGQNIRIGDDLWIGDVNINSTARLMGGTSGDPTKAYLIFGNSDANSLGRSGTGPLTYTAAFQVNGTFTVTNTTNATSTSSAALIVAGGVGIGGNLYVGGTIFGLTNITGTITSATNIAGGLLGQIPYQTAAGTTGFIGTGTTGSILQMGANTATFVTTGSIYVGYANQAANATTATSAAIAYSLANSGSLTIGSATTATNLAGGTNGAIHYQVSPGISSFIGTGTTGSLLQMGATTATFVTTGSIYVGYSVTATNIIGGASGSIPYQTAAGATQFINIGSAGQVLQSNGSTASFVSVGTLSAGTATSVAGGSLGQILYQTAAGVTGFIGTGTAGTILQMGAATTATFVTTGSIHVGASNFAVTATSAAVAYSLANTGTTYVGRAVFADNAGTSSQVTTVAQTANATYFLTFVDANNATAAVETVHTTSSFTINASSGGVRIGGVTTVTNTTNATSTVTGALQVAGGMGVGRDLWVGAGVYAATKSFLIDHPSKPGWKLVHGSLEGPENGVYVRGKITGSNKIHLPDFWINLVDFDTITVNLTPIGKYQQLFVENIEGLEITIANAEDSDMNFFYTVWAERIDVDKLRVEVN